MTLPVVIIGAGGHAKVIMDTLLLRSHEYSVLGLTDQDRSKWGLRFHGVPILGDDSVLDEMEPTGYGLIVALGDNHLRSKLFERYMERGFRAINAIHPRSVIASSASLGKGVAVMANAVINSDAVIGNNVIVNTGATVDHDCVLQDHVHIAPGAHLGGVVEVGRGTQISIGANVIPEITIGPGAMIGAGTVVIRNVEAESTVVGVPGQQLPAS